MRTKIILLSFLLFSSLAYSQVGINTESPEATLDIVGTGTTEYLPLKILPISSNIGNTASEINYNRASKLYIDENGYVFSAFSPAQINGTSMSFDVKGQAITTSWLTLYTLPHTGSIAEFSFLTNLAFGSGSQSLISGKVMVGYGTSINVYAYNTTVNQGTLTNNLSNSVSIVYSSGANLLFQLTDNNELQVKISQAAASTAVMSIYDSSVTRTY